VLTDASLRLPGVTHVEIHHDKANFASAGVPRRRGFWLLGEIPDEIEAPAERGSSVGGAWIATGGLRVVKARPFVERRDR
jgi:hypothetical protein